MQRRRPSHRAHSREPRREAPGAFAQARAARETPEEQEARRRRKRVTGVRAVKRHWHYQALKEAGAEMPRTPPTSPRVLRKRGFEHAMQEWRRELSERVEQRAQRGDFSEVYLDKEHERIVIRASSWPVTRSREAAMGEMVFQ